MAVIKLTTAVRNAMGDAILAALNAGSGAALLKVYDGTQPAGPATAVTSQTLLGTLTFSDPAGSTSGGVITFDTITQDSAADATGTASWVRLCDSTGAAVIDGDATVAAGSGFFKLNTLSIVAGGPIKATSGSLTMPGG
jgi:hypothetical protein